MATSFLQSVSIKDQLAEVLTGHIVDIYNFHRANEEIVSWKMLDEMLQARDDWVIYRLCRERQDQHKFVLPPKTVSSFSLLMASLARIAEGKNDYQKWGALGLLTDFLVGIVQTPLQRWCLRTRADRNRGGTDILPIDRLDENALQGLLRWSETRIGKLAKTFDHTVRNPLRLNRHQRLRREELVAAEKLLILGVATISNVLLRSALNGVDGLAFERALITATEFFNAANGGWEPGRVLYTWRLRHATRYPELDAASCFLPFDAISYNNLFARTFGQILLKTEGVLPDWVRFSWGMSGIKHGELVYRSRRRGRFDKEGVIDPFVTGLSRCHELAVELGRFNDAGALAARFLDGQSSVGWLGAPKGRFDAAKFLKPSAIMMGCSVPESAMQTDFSTKADEAIPEIHQFEKQFGYEAQSKLSAVQDSPSDESSEEFDSDITSDIDKIQNALSIFREHNQSEMNFRWTCLWRIGKALTPGKDTPENLAKLLKIYSSAYRLSRDHFVPGNIALLVQAIVQHAPHFLSFFKQSHVVVEFARILLYALERPYMADSEKRGDWQALLWELYQSLPSSVRDKLSLNDQLLIYETIAHVSGATLRAMPNIYALAMESTPGDEMPLSIDVEMMDEPTGDTGKRPERETASLGALQSSVSLRIDSQSLHELFDSYRGRGRTETAFVQLIISRNGQTAFLHVARERNGSIHHGEVAVTFAPSTFKGDGYKTWDDIEDFSSSFTYFVHSTGKLKSFDETPLAHPSIRKLWKQLDQLIRRLGNGHLSDHICFAVSGSIANLPWQLIAIANTHADDPWPIVTFIHGLRWVYVVAHANELQSQARFAANKRHFRGIQAWIESEDSLGEDIAKIRLIVVQSFFGADTDKPVLTNVRGLSLSVVFGHGMVPEGSVHAKTIGVDMEAWEEVRDARICLLLSCETGKSTSGGLKDLLGLTLYLCRNAKTVLAPSVQFPSTAAKTLAESFYTALKENMRGTTRNVQDVYRDAVEKDRTVALFSLWGLGYEQLILPTS
jgi:hypothetical protein